MAKYAIVHRPSGEVVAVFRTRREAERALRRNSMRHPKAKEVFEIIRLG